MRATRRRLTLPRWALYAALAAAIPASAADWSGFGPGGGGHLCRVAFDPDDPMRLYVGSDVTGVFRSTDGGARWQASNEGLSDLYVRALAVVPGSEVVYAATAQGLARSDDGGALWRTVLELPVDGNGSKYAAAISTVTVDPLDPDVLWAGVGGFRLSDVAGPGGDTAGEWAHLLRSTTGGEGSWEEISGPWDSGGVHSIVPLGVDVDPSHPGSDEVLISGTEGVYRVAWNGTGWEHEPRDGGLPHADSRDLEAMRGPNGSIERLYLVLDSRWDAAADLGQDDAWSVYDAAGGHGGGVWFSDDLGHSWCPTSDVDGSDGLRLEDGYESTDGGGVTTPFPKNVRHLAVDRESGTVYLALTWRSMRNEGIWRAEPSPDAVCPGDSAWSWTRLTESRTFCQTCDVNVDLDHFTSLGGVDGLEVQPSTHDVVFTTNQAAYRCPGGGCEPGVVGAARWQPLHTTILSPPAPEPTTYATTGLDVTRTDAVVVVPDDRAVWLMGIHDFGLMRSDDAGRSWRPIGDVTEPPYSTRGARNVLDLAFAPEPGYPELAAIVGSWQTNEFDLWFADGVPDDVGTVWTRQALDGDPYVRTVHYIDADHLLVGTDDGIFRGERGPEGWSFVADMAGIAAEASPKAIAFEAAPGDDPDRRTLVATSWSRSPTGETRLGGLWYRDGWGATWLPAVYLPGGPGGGTNSLTSLAWSPTSDDTVIAGSATSGFNAPIAGVLRSDDRGESWAMTDQGFGDEDPSCFDVRAVAIRRVPGTLPARERYYAALAPRDGITRPPCVAETWAGVYVSDDGGDRWQELRSGLDSGQSNVLEADATHPSRLFLGTVGNGARVLVDDFDGDTAPGEASPAAGLRMQARRGPVGEVSVEYSPARCAAEHTVYWGITDAIAPPGPQWTGQACYAGTRGELAFVPEAQPAGSLLYFVVVGNDGAREGSYGRDRSGTERPAADELPGCAYQQALATACPASQVPTDP